VKTAGWEECLMDLVTSAVVIVAGMIPALIPESFWLIKKDPEVAVLAIKEE